MKMTLEKRLQQRLSILAASEKREGVMKINYL